MAVGNGTERGVRVGAGTEEVDTQRAARRCMRSRAGNRARWRAHVAAQLGSELSAAAYCRAHGLHPQSFSRWKRILLASGEVSASVSTKGDARSNGVKRGAVPLFAEVRVSQAQPAASGVEVCLGGGRVIRVAPDFDAPNTQGQAKTWEASPYSRGEAIDDARIHAWHG